MAREDPLLYMVGTENLSLKFMVPPINTTKHNKFLRDTERLQWFAIGHGYNQTPEIWTGHYEQEEHNCVLRYLNKFGWKPAHECTCGTVVESFKEAE